jgi:predicted alpha-1,2-mannosidase
MLKNTFRIVLIILLLTACQKQTEKKFIKLTPYQLVNPFIGTGGHGHTYPGATAPFGMVQLSPDTRLDGWDGCSGYHNDDSVIYGFSHTHLSGTGISDYGDVLLMPFNTAKNLTFSEVVDKKIIPSSFSKNSEEAHPGFYKVHLDKPDVDVQLTTTTRVGIHKYHFNKPSYNKILLDLAHRDKLLDFKLEVLNNTTIAGYRTSQAWANEQHVYFYMTFSESFEANIPKNTHKDKAFYRLLSFKNNIKNVIVKVGISATSIEGAKLNLESEAKADDFETYRLKAKQNWEKQLDKIAVKGTNITQLKVFYTALYHTQIVPNIFSDVDGKYRGLDQKIHQDKRAPTYTVFSLWDTFRAAHPLYTILEQKRTTDFINTFLKHYEQGGKLPVWELAANETNCMIGYHAVSVIQDAYAKGIRGFDAQKTLKAMINSSGLPEFGLPSYIKNGYIVAGDESESVSKTLEYAYDDWCIAQFAKEIGNDDIAQKFTQRALNYQNIFDPSTKFMRAKNNGLWFAPFDPFEVNFNYTEANAWQYNFFVPQDINGLVQLMGGDNEFEKQLDKLFTVHSKTSGREQADITGLIGQYAQGNEPSHHMAYLYNYIGKAYKTQERVRQILTTQYKNSPDGLSGNEDCGQMSAWYVLSASGFYPVTPGLAYYTIGTPLFDKVTYNLENGKTFGIEAQNLSDKNIYIQKAYLNGKLYPYSYIKHATIEKGGVLKFVMGAQPNKDWSSKIKYRPHSKIESDGNVSLPYFEAQSYTFLDSLQVSLNKVESKGQLYYRFKDTKSKSWQLYTKPLQVTKTARIEAKTVLKNSIESKIISATFNKIKKGRSITLKSGYANQYAAGGKTALIDQLKGSNNYKTGYWQGYQGQDITAIIDLGKTENIKRISVGFLQDIISWIWYPKQVTFYASADGKKFTKIKTITNNFSIRKEGSFTKEFGFKTNLKTRYIKMVAQNRGAWPSWHLGAGGKSWLFTDEITIE